MGHAIPCHLPYDRVAVPHISCEWKEGIMDMASRRIPAAMDGIANMQRCGKGGFAFFERLGRGLEVADSRCQNARKRNILGPARVIDSDMSNAVVQRWAGCVYE